MNTTEEIIEDIRAGRMVILMDDEDRENEGDLVMAASLRSSCLRVRFREAVEPGAEDHQPADPLAPALVDDVEHPCGGDGHDGQVDPVGDVEDALVGPHARHVPPGRVHRVDRALEAVREQVAEDRRADRAGASRGADHGHGAGAEDGVEAARGPTFEGTVEGLAHRFTCPGLAGGTAGIVTAGHSHSARRVSPAPARRPASSLT